MARVLGLRPWWKWPEASIIELTGRQNAGFVLGNRPELDGFRGVAVLLVVAMHTTLFLLPGLAGRFVPGGFIGVDLFFVLSGFLITSLLLQELRLTGRIKPGAFYRRRAWRLLPALYVFLAVQVLYTVIMRDSLRHELAAVMLIVAYVGNWSADLHVFVPYSLAQTWSLGIEEQFYLLWPLVLIWLTRFGARRVMWGLTVAVMTVAFMRAGLLAVHVDPAWIYSQTQARLDALLIGSLLAYALAYGWRAPEGLNVVAVPALAVLVVVVATGRPTASWLYDGGFTLVAVCAAVVLLAALEEGWIGWALRARWLRACGRTSYSLYLWHPLIFIAVSRQMAHRRWWERSAVGFGLLAVVVTASYLLVEKPLRRRGATGRSPRLQLPAVKSAR